MELPLLLVKTYSGESPRPKVKPFFLLASSCAFSVSKSCKLMSTRLVLPLLGVEILFLTTDRFTSMNRPLKSRSPPFQNLCPEFAGHSLSRFFVTHFPECSFPVMGYEHSPWFALAFNLLSDSHSHKAPHFLPEFIHGQGRSRKPPFRLWSPVQWGYNYVKHFIDFV